MAKKKSRSAFTILAALLTVGALAYAFWPRPTMVDIGQVTRGSMMVTIDEEGKTRVRDAYVVSTPVAGRLMRVEADPGDAVIKNETIVARMRPTNPSALDIRTREQARAAVTAAEAALRVARADLNKAIGDLDYARSEWKRTEALSEQGTASTATLELKRKSVRSASAMKDNAEAAIAVREAELANARARLISFDGSDLASAKFEEKAIPLRAPTTGRILRILQQSETTLPAGSKIMEIGNIDNDLEVEVDLLSSDAVQISPGDRVLIEQWGGSDQLEGKVERIDPWGYEKYSSLGVEEQRVNAIIQFTGSEASRSKLGHGYRVEVKIIIWQQNDILLIPSNALFRDGQDWAVFKVVDGRAEKTNVTVGKDNGLKAQILDGLNEGDQIILYPSSGITSGIRVKQRVVE
ncbi:HlyD family secretion protein [Cohaesibacter sp. ES.047]|uniref:efflux RND transporter periplasmic adaptor subunit n=1 Tax=Cohaesibacter sp. ES.047 TaxID=1798205 RepID=UPI000BB9B250|nr:HlyD family efflux transporter periplasmic adaptor subunit [Cohaesibacter sp. ES.047]SNY91556.1 HlyD family secretion protein [Cohaesibacter sp. ES.047]